MNIYKSNIRTALFGIVLIYLFCQLSCEVIISATNVNEKAAGTHMAVPILSKPVLKRTTRDVDKGTKNVDLKEKTKTSDKFPMVDLAHEPIISKFELNNSHHQVMVDWAGEGSQVVVCVTKDLDQNINSTTNVYISYDYGKTFKDKSKEFKINNKFGLIYKFYKNEKFTDRFIFADTFNKYLFVTNDYGYTIYPRELGFTPSEISMHPTNSHTFLIMDREDKMKKLWVTSDFGETWNILSFYVRSYYWSEKTAVPTLYVERDEPGNFHTVIAFTSFSGDSNFEHRIVINGVQEFVIKDDFLFAIKKKPKLLGAKSDDDTLQLWIAYREGPFLLAQFPNNLTHYQYYVADVSEGQIMVCVFHGISSNLYVSYVPRSPGEQIKFSLSLERILHFSPNTNWNNTWLSKKATENFADLHRVQGVRGVFIASQLIANYSKTNTNLSPSHLTSFISFDQGAAWQPLIPPQTNGDGSPTSCKLPVCSLHISQELSRLFPETQSRPILTSKSSPGLILATGTLGASLKGHPGIFISTDAGYSWHHILRGNYLYTLGDHGGLILAVQHYRSNGETNELLYSVDEGETWHSHQFFPEKIRVYGLMTEPGENTTIFTLFGSKLEKHEWIIVKIDMTPVFKYKCTKDDYKSWSPFDAASGRFCLLGRRDVYERRVPHSNCYNGKDYDRPVSSENCPCTRGDYECDFGFVSMVLTSEKSLANCVKDEDDIINPFGIPFSCKHGKFYNRTKGYRMIPGDTCVGGEQERYDPVLTPCPLDEEKEFLLVSNRKKILRYDLLNPEKGLQPLPLNDLEAVIALDFDLKNNCLYWSSTTDKILRQCFDGEHHQETLIDSQINSVEGLALDWVSGSLYFVDGTRKTVEVIRVRPPFSPKMRVTVLGAPTLDLPRGIALHPVKGLMFLTDWSDSNPVVAKAHLDGKNFQVLFGRGQVSWPNGIAVDFQTERIFWADAKLDYIASSDIDGKGFKKIISESDKVRQPFAVGVYKTMLYWDDWASFQIFQADKENGYGAITLSPQPMKGLVDLKVFGHWSQSGSNACGSPDNDCQFFCMGAPGNEYTCMCPTWLKIVKDGKRTKCQCQDGSEPNARGVCKDTKNTCAPDFFQCDNHMCIPKTMLCDMDDDCGDLSDERNCSRSTCDGDSWHCNNGHCISPAWKCDMDNDCGDNSDEQSCIYEKCTEDQFTCKNKRCIDKKWVCDLQDDCRDGSDEANCTYTEAGKGNCNSIQFQCRSSGICLPISWRCDREKDCSDNSDEEGCDNHKCSQFQFQCTNNRCIYMTWICDGDKDCEDGLDEKDCPSVPSSPTTPSSIPLFPTSKNDTCSSFEFRCLNGNCIPFWWRCDNASDCLDGSDETDCFSDLPSPAEKFPSNPSTKKPFNFECREDQMECSNGECIWEAWVCDGDKDCFSGEDEENCHSKAACAVDQFRCWHSEGCIEAQLRCNGHPDCADGSDEMGCQPVIVANTTDAVPSCSHGLFSCDGGNCLPAGKRCDYNIDCIDMTDEKNCTKEDNVYQVSHLRDVSISNVSLEFEWDMKAVNGTTFEFLPSCIVQSALGNPQAWRNGTWTSQKSYIFDHLEPHTTYLLKVYVKAKETNQIFAPAEIISMATAVGIPSPPREVRMNQVAERLLIEWKTPLNPNGPVVSYRVYVSPPEPPKLFEVEEGTHKLFFLPSELQQNFTIWMTCSNTKYTSEASERVSFTPSSVDRAVSNLSVKAKSISEVTLVWQPIPNVDGYIVSYVYPENQFMGPKFSINVTESEVELEGLAPGLKYVFKVRGYKDNAIGPFSTLEVTTLGQKLPALSKVQSEVLKSPGTTVQVSWEKPIYKQEHIWQYRILWGKTITELKQHVNMAETTNTTHLIRHLDACELYMMTVMIAGPIGFGPTIEFPVRTREDPLAPPKSVDVKAENEFMSVTWVPPCPAAKDNALRYLVTINETAFNKTSYFDVPSDPLNVTQGYKVQMHYGGKYRVSVRTYLEGSRESNAEFIQGPRIPPPYGLTFTHSDDSFFWKNDKNTPTKLLKNHSYILYLTLAGQNNTSDGNLEIEVKEPPYQARELSPGQIYYAAVAFKDPDGYLSEKSQDIPVEKPVGDRIVVTQSSVFGVAVSVTIVIIVLVILVGVMAVRHKRLARSFSAFANSHYDRSQGTTHITTDHNLDEDDSPMIRGFSDDEPLVIA